MRHPRCSFSSPNASSSPLFWPSYIALLWVILHTSTSVLNLALLRCRILKYHYSLLHAAEMCLNHFRWNICTHPVDEDLGEDVSGECAACSSLQTSETHENFSQPSPAACAGITTSHWSASLCLKISTKRGDHKPDLSCWSLRGAHAAQCGFKCLHICQLSLKLWGCFKGNNESWESCLLKSFLEKLNEKCMHAGVVGEQQRVKIMK